MDSSSEDRFAPCSQPADSVKCCILCGDKGTQMTKYTYGGSAEKHFAYTHLGKWPPDDSYTCKKHLVEAQRHHHDETFIPKWKCTENSPKGCVHPQCENRLHPKLINPAFATTKELKTHLGILVTDDIPFLLCPPCYSKVNYHFNSPIKCSSCGATSKPGQKFIRYSLNSTLISKYLTETIGTEIVIEPSDRICTSCYNTHSSIIKSLQTKLSGTDEMLQKAIDTWDASIKKNDADKLKASILTSVIFVAQSLLSQKAVLLPWTCHIFLEAYGVQDEDAKSVSLKKDNSIFISVATRSPYCSFASLHDAQVCAHEIWNNIVLPRCRSSCCFVLGPQFITS